jgi:hypothetical protein
MRRTAAVLALALLAVAGCSGDDDAEPVSLTAQRAGAYQPPASCTGLGVQAGAQVKGADLATCIDDSLEAHVTGRQTLSAGQDGGVVAVTYSLGDPQGYESGGSQDFVVIGDQAWIRAEDGWVESDPDGKQEQQQAAQLADSLTGDFVVQTATIAASGTWRVGRPRTIELRQGGTVQDAWPVSVAAPYAVDGTTPVTRHVVWLDRTLSPVKIELDATVDGSAARSTAEMYALGEKITITAPQ